MIGKGSQAKVYKIERIQDSSIFAVKIFKSEKLTNKDKGLVFILISILIGWFTKRNRHNEKTRP